MFKERHLYIYIDGMLNIYEQTISVIFCRVIHYRHFLNAATNVYINTNEGDCTLIKRYIAIILVTV